MAGARIEIEQLSKSFDGGQSFAVQHARVTVRPAAWWAWVGGGGSGKATLLKCINRLIEPDSGEVRIDGEPVGSADPPALRRRIGYVFQDIGLSPHMSVAENIGVTPQLLGWPRQQIAARTAELLDLVGLPQSYAARFPAALSGGERQRGGAARAIAARPKIVLMDEPFGALDPITRDALGSAYRALHEKLELTTIMVTHDVQEAVLLAAEIVVMKRGRVLAQDIPRALLSEHVEPDVRALLAMPKRQAERIRAVIGEGGPP